MASAAFDGFCSDFCSVGVFSSVFCELSRTERGPCVAVSDFTITEMLEE